MKKIKLMMMTLMMCFMTVYINAQTKELILDSLKDNKITLLYKTKMFISEKLSIYNSTIQNVDTTTGIIVVNGTLSAIAKENNNYYNVEHTFFYVLTFFHKNNKCKIVFSLINPSQNVYVTASAMGNTLNTISTGKPNTNTYNSNNSFYKKIDISSTWEGPYKTGISQKGFYKIQTEITSTINTIILSYKQYMNTTTEDNW